MSEKNNCCSASEGCCGEPSVIEIVKEYYGKTLQSNRDLLSGACCSLDKPPVEIRNILPLIADEILSKFYGCGSPLPPLLEGMTVLDLGCGTGRDVYIASKLVGETGRVIGVDMTTEQIETAKKYREEQRQRFGFKSLKRVVLGCDSLMGMAKQTYGRPSVGNYQKSGITRFVALLRHL